MAPDYVFTLTESPFVVDGLLEIPDLVDEPGSTWQPLQRESHVFAFDVELTEKKQETLTDLSPGFYALASNEPFPELGSSVDSTSASELGEAASEKESSRDDEILEDVWSWEDVISGTRENKLVNWDTFLQPESEKPRSAYLSEADPACFDPFLAIQASQRNVKLPRVVAPHKDFLRSLFELGMGRDSLLYRYERAIANFVPTSEDFGLTGIAFATQQHVLQNVQQMGTAMRQIEAYVAVSKLRPLSIALSSAISTVFYATKAKLQASQRSIQTILQLEDIFARPSCLVQALQNLVKCLKTVDRDEDAIVKLLNEAETLISSHSWLTKLLHEILGRTLAPWISIVVAEAGLRSSTRTSQAQALISFGSLEAKGRTPEGKQETPLTPIGGLLTESRRCLEILGDQQVDHPVLNQSRHISSDLSWEASWEGIEQLRARANAYEQSLKAAILEYSHGNSSVADHQTGEGNDDLLPEEDEGLVMINFDRSNVLDRDLGEHASPFESTLSRLTTAALRANTDFSDLPNRSELYPPLSQSLSLSLIPSLNAQSRLLSFSTLDLLFRTHSLRHHLSLQYRFQLLSDGLFAARLTRALFDPDQSSSERRRTTEGSTGLRLQARDLWPPASSELRLVLMGILSESYYTTALSNDLSAADMPGNLSFAIRDLTVEELEKCRDVSSIEALDFLRLQYKPPPVLESVISQASLRKYDQIFKHLLRLLRLQALAQSLLRDVAGRTGKVDLTTQRFRIDIQNFVSTLAAYSHNDTISLVWTSFEHSLQDIEDAIKRGDYESTLAKAGSLSRLERLHEGVLDRIIEGLFLNRRQAQVRELIEGIFRLILRFSTQLTRRRDDNDTGSDRDDLKTMHMEFGKQVSRLVRYLRSQRDAGKRQLGNESDGAFLSSDGPPPPFEHLLIKLDMFGYYS